MGRTARPLHDPGNNGAIERGSNLQAARRGGLMKPAKPAGERKNTAALTPSLGTRSRFWLNRVGSATNFLFEAFPIGADSDGTRRQSSKNSPRSRVFRGRR